MRRSYTSIDTFLDQVFGNTTEAVGQIQQIQHSQGYLCPTASDLAVHLILELYDQASNPEANITRISSNLEIAAEELLYLSRRVKGLR